MHKVENAAKQRVYAIVHKKEIAATHSAYYWSHKEKLAAQSKANYDAHPGRATEYGRRRREEHRLEVNEYQRNWVTEHYAQVHAANIRWAKEHPEETKIIGRRQNAKHRTLGFNPLNFPFLGCEGHHINRTDVIYIPKIMHASVRHNVWTGRGMDKINTLAGQYLTEDWT